MRYFVHSEETISTMLGATKKSSIDELFSSIPKSARVHEQLKLPPKMDEMRLKEFLEPFYYAPACKNFLGAGCTMHFVPEWVSQQLMRAEWYTSYTPYQPEASQGTLQAIFEFQTMVSSLFGLECANASMYDGATALVEALLMAIRTTGKKTVIVPTTVHPEYRRTILTYFSFTNFRMIEVDFAPNGVVDKLDDVCRDVSHDLAAIAFSSPNFFGRIEDGAALVEQAHAHNALAIGVITDMTAASVLPSLGSLGVDIAVGEGLGLLGGISLGGPGVGLFATKKSLLRQLPGRIVGETRDKNARTGYVLTLSTREQHIRREKATSNICTNHNLMALAFAMTLAAYGKTGFARLGTTNIKKTLYFRRCLAEHDVAPRFVGAHYNETVIDVGARLHTVLEKAAREKIIPGLALEKFYPDLKGHLLVSTTELAHDRDIKRLSAIISGVDG